MCISWHNSPIDWLQTCQTSSTKYVYHNQLFPDPTLNVKGLRQWSKSDVLLMQWENNIELHIKRDCFRLIQKNLVAEAAQRPCFGFLSYKNSMAPKTRFEWDSGVYYNFIKKYVSWSYTFPTFTNKNSFLAETWYHFFLAWMWRFGEWVKEIYWAVKNIWCRSCLVFTSLAHKHSCSLSHFISVNHCDRQSRIPFLCLLRQK